MSVRSWLGVLMCAYYFKKQTLCDHTLELRSCFRIVIRANWFLIYATTRAAAAVERQWLVLQTCCRIIYRQSSATLFFLQQKRSDKQIKIYAWNKTTYLQETKQHIYTGNTQSNIYSGERPKTGFNGCSLVQQRKAFFPFHCLEFLWLGSCNQ